MQGTNHGLGRSVDLAVSRRPGLNMLGQTNNHLTFQSAAGALASLGPSAPELFNKGIIEYITSWGVGGE